MAILSQTSAFGPGVYRGHPFSKERLRSFIEGTNRAIAAGIPIPLLRKHARINASDNETEQFATKHGQGAGWITKVDMDQDGSLIWEAKDVPSDVAADVTKNIEKFTSPEFRNFYKSEKDGVYEGPIIRHIAFTPLPGNPHQGPIVETDSGSSITSLALEETQDAWQFHEAEREPLPAELETADETQHSEKRHESVLESHGYSPASSTAIGTHWMNGQHSVMLSKGGKWNHRGGGFNVSGSTAKELKEHLGSIHGSQHEEPIPPKETGTAADQYSEDSWVLPFADFMAYMRDEATEQFAHRDPVDHAHASELMAVHSYVDQKGASPNKYGFVGQQHGAIVKNLNNKKKRGVYDHEKAKKLFGYYAKSLSNHYAKHHGGLKANPATRHHVASILADEYHGGSQQHVEQPLPDINPDMPPKTPDRNKLAAIMAGLAQKNIVLPSDFDFQKDGAMDVLLGCINSAIKAENETKAQLEPPDPDNEPVTEAAMPFAEGSGQFTEYEVIGRTYTARGATTGSTGSVGGLGIGHVKSHIEKMKSGESLDVYHKGKRIGGVFHDPHKGKIFSKELESHLSSQHSEGSEQFKEPTHIGNGYYFHKQGNDLNGNHSVWISKGSGRAKKIQTNQNLPKFHRDRQLNDHTKRELLSHLSSSQFNELPDDPELGSKPKPTQLPKGDYITQFSEEELAAMPPSVKEKLDAEVKAQTEKRREAEQKAQQFEEEKRVQLNNNAREKAVASIKASPLPPALKKALLTGYAPQNGKDAAIQFSEGSEMPVYTAQQVAELFKQNIPKHLQFEEGDVEASAPPINKRQVGTDSKGLPVYAEDASGEQFFEAGEVLPGHISPERAKELLATSPVTHSQSQRRRVPTIGEDVADMNRRANSY